MCGILSNGTLQLVLRQTQREIRNIIGLGPLNKFDVNKTRLQRFSYASIKNVDSGRAHWKRPPEVPYPSVWHRFEGKRPLTDGGPMPRFRVQDIPEERFDDVLEIIGKHFIRDEPMLNFAGFASEINPDHKKVWTPYLDHKLGLMCVIDEPDSECGGRPAIVGVNITYPVFPEQGGNNPELYTGSIKKVYQILKVFADECDILNQFDLDVYLGAAGLFVLSEYRGQAIGGEILKARTPFCKALGIRLTASTFSSTTAQQVAAQVGFRLLKEITYEDLRKKHGIDLPGIETQTPSCKMMIQQFD